MIEKREPLVGLEVLLGALGNKAIAALDHFGEYVSIKQSLRHWLASFRHEVLAIQRDGLDLGHIRV
jgi:hypothetical protein